MKAGVSESNRGFVRKLTPHWVHEVLNIGMILIDLGCEAVMKFLGGFERAKSWSSFEKDVQ